MTGGEGVQASKMQVSGLLGCGPEERVAWSRAERGLFMCAQQHPRSRQALPAGLSGVSMQLKCQTLDSEAENHGSLGTHSIRVN